jgi:tetratricopeptide (TPR) repeat protein
VITETNQRTRVALVIVATLSLLVAPMNSFGFWGDDDRVDMSFKEVFPQAFYKKSYFGWVLLGTTIVAAAAISYATAGAGAPAAATGVGSVASAIGGGGAGSYMAGLSMVGGWVGGNAMVGAAILNGISLGLGGGTAAFPTRIGDSAVQYLAEEFEENDSDLLEAASDKDEAAWAEATEFRNVLVESAEIMGNAALERANSPQDMLVLGLINRNVGNDDLGDALIDNIPIDRLTSTGYLSYVQAVMKTENGHLDEAVQLLRQVRESDPYAIEPTLLLINLMGHQGFLKNEQEMQAIVRATEKSFDKDEYDTNYGLLALNYRMASMHFLAGKYDEAQRWYESAYESIPFIQERFGARPIRNLVRLGIANSLYAQGKTVEAEALMNEILDDADGYEQKQALLVQYVGNK